MDKKYRPKAGCWSFFFLVLILGTILALIQIGVGIGLSLRIPATNFSLSAGGSLGKKVVAEQVLPNYLRSQIASNNTFFNHTSTMTIWIAEGIGIIVLGEQPEAPDIDLNVSLLR